MWSDPLKVSFKVYIIIKGDQLETRLLLSVENKYKHRFAGDFSFTPDIPTIQYIWQVYWKISGIEIKVRFWIILFTQFQKGAECGKLGNDITVSQFPGIILHPRTAA